MDIPACSALLLRKQARLAARDCDGKRQHTGRRSTEVLLLFSSQENVAGKFSTYHFSE
jgi:hypothetical protein